MSDDINIFPEEFTDDEMNADELEDKLDEAHRLIKEYAEIKVVNHVSPIHPHPEQHEIVYVFDIFRLKMAALNVPEIVTELTINKQLFDEEIKARILEGKYPTEMLVEALINSNIRMKLDELRMQLDRIKSDHDFNANPDEED